MRGRFLSLPAAVVLALAAPDAALAHGIQGEAESIPEFIWLGIRHMVGGWDHLLFILGIVLLAGTFLWAAKLISLFVAGHSTTLLIATLAGWQLNADAVDVVIALSVAYIGWRILQGQPRRWRWTGTVIFAFGLVHGLGLSTRLQEQALPTGGALVARILAFNLGVEIGQLLALSLLVGAGLLLLRLRPALAARRPAAAAALLAVGVVAAALVSLLAIRPGEGASASLDPTEAGCSEGPYVPSLSEGAFGGHPEQVFYGPDEAAVRADLQHVMGDGFIIVVYRPSLPPPQLADLRTWVEAGNGVIGVPGAGDTVAAVEASTLRSRLTCTELSIEALDEFRGRWFGGG